ncbi:DedA family protein [Cereibacter changlensis JA139]|uniref:DedA family protein n=2 Tax=Cereibacter changlensis TaxID=402884 RepID=A0A2T4JVS4_9RHOB|nr:DedA family protein [Cereibacter changlensis]PTE22004.1 DedA family protein [Cereibacter changlensis JA139]PZX57276.1 membrane protein DedA with SNARE-associated domain [Cereibacter changlensis]
MFDWITGLIESIGALGVALLMLLENVFPPIPSELVMPLAGFIAAGGGASLWVMILAGTVGAVAGALFWYWVGRRLGARRLRELAWRHGRWMAVAPEDIDKGNDWFARHGAAAVLIGRMIPTVRTFVSVPAGVARMPLLRFIFYTTLGSAFWVTLLTVAGYLLESQYEAVSGIVNPVATLVVVGLVGWYLWRVATYRRRVPLEE